MVYLGHMLPTSEIYEQKVKDCADRNTLTAEEMLNRMIDYYLEHE